MKYIIKNLLIISTAVVIVLPIYSSPNSSNESDKILVSIEWLNQHINDEDLIIFYVGMPDNFKDGHIPGSILMPFRQIITPRAEDVLSDEFPAYAQLDSVFESLGVNTRSKIVVYYGDDRFIPLATRTMVTLEYLGYEDNVFLLNGGYTKWLSENEPVNSEDVGIEKGIIDKDLNDSFLIKSQEILDNLESPNFWIVDARPEESYIGSEGGHFSRSGHIKSAINIPFTDLLDPDDSNVFKNDDELKQVFTDNFINSDSEIVFYCGTGIWATVDYVIAKHLGFSNIKFYDGSFEEWSSIEGLPVVEPIN